MDTIIDQWKKRCEKRHDEAMRRYSQIILRYDAPEPGDVEALEETMKILKVDLRQLEADVHVIGQYRAYTQNGEKPKPHSVTQGCKKDADEIRRRNSRLFVALEDGKKGTAGNEPHVSSPCSTAT